MTYAIALGCSHTAGSGNDPADCYASLLQAHYGFLIVNHGIPGGGGTDVLINITQAVKSLEAPKFIVAQWPNPFRKHNWINNTLHLENVNYCSESFKLLLKDSDKNFLEPWIQSIVIGNLLCKLAQIPIINIMLETVDDWCIDRLQKENINLHVDKKVPGQTWLFDNGAQDGIHHSPACHSQWTNRLIGIIDEHTAP